MTRITERSDAYPGGVRGTSTTEATRFRSSCTMSEGTLLSISDVLRVGDGYFVFGNGGGMVPSGGSLELAYEPDGGAGASDLWTGDEGRDRNEMLYWEDEWPEIPW